ncbi:M20 family metallopeptidase [Paenarthrobacter sp. PH39-S1]|uniref:M20 metallopeptidase family protein n=1 Tax=Paenarthrobacter sp. PH39-S1 TaxID=3046204 RepID=UPI0024BBE6FA|nr:M20 family metallopeptidase [Paenarthrobacter sp. PH39-S1]MDJ0356229.1 M20 family metallopeptidase [Paenarthrobacter sp. PH39-S1]
MVTVPSLQHDADAIRDEIIDFRRALHRIPEIGLDLPLTQRLLLDRLEDLDGLEITLGHRQSAVTAVLRGGRLREDGTAGPVVLLRGDMDALPVSEETGLDFSSEIPGSMHACGHDMHVAALYGAVRVLHQRREDLCGDVVFMFQPGEEDYNGARFMVEDGVLDAAGRRVEAAFGLHVFSGKFDNGVFYSRPGTLMAGCEEFYVTVRGEGGHGSQPHLAKDPVPVACEMVLAMQTLVTRGFDVFDPVVATVGRIAAGTLGNIIPDTASFDLTLRVFSSENRDKIVAGVQRLCRGIADAHGMTVELVQTPDYPVTVNAPQEHQYLTDIITKTFGTGSFRELDVPMTGSEDFSHVLHEVPGAYVLLGATLEEEPLKAAMNHSPRAAFDDSLLPKAAAVLAELAFQRADYSA